MNLFQYLIFFSCRKKSMEIISMNFSDVEHFNHAEVSYFKSQMLLV